MSIEHLLEQYQTAKLPNSTWLKPIRDRAIAEFEDLQLPALKDEQWKYTRAKAFVNERLVTAKNDTGLSQNQLPTALSQQCLVFIDGYFNAELSTAESCYVLSQQLDNDIVKNTLNTVADSKASGFMALNTAMMQDGYVIHVTKQTEQVIHVMFVNTQQHALTHQRNIIVVEPNCQAEVIEQHISINNDNHYLSNTVTEIQLQANAHLTLYKLQQESLNAQHLSSTYVTQQRDSVFKHFNIDFGGQHVRNWLQSDLNEQNAYAEFNGLYIVNDKQHIDNHTRVVHNAAHTNSNELYKGVLSGKCRGVFNGQVHIVEDAQKVNASQQNNNLLLSDGAEIDTKPQLEIYADDVKCAHGATIGQLDETALFYLQSRGVDRTTARNMLISGFAQAVIDMITNEQVNNYLTTELNKQL